MKFKFAALPLMLVSAFASAEQYNSFTDADYENRDYRFGDVDTLSVQSQYYFGALNTLGPRKEFNYILPVSNIYGGVASVDFGPVEDEIVTFGGEYYTGDWKVFGEFNDFFSTNIYSVGAGFLFSRDLLAEVEAEKMEDEDTVVYVRGKYNHQLTGTDYIGFTAEIDDGFDYRSLSSKYFTALSGGQYLTAELGITDTDGADFYWNGALEFYFNENTSVGVAYDELVEDYEINATHFFNRNVAAKVAYGSNRDFDDLDMFRIGVTVQL